MKRIKLLILLSLLFISTPLYAIDAKREVLPNGLVLLHSEKHNLPIVKVTLLIKASPFNEPPEKAGLANLVASLLTEGTKNRTSEQISEEIEFLGAHLGAATDRDYTLLKLSILKKDLEKGFSIFSDILLNPVFPPEEIKRKIDLIKGGLRQAEEEPGFLASREFRRTLYGKHHPYGRLVEGTLESLDNINREDIVGFYKTYYRPNNAIVAIVGDITHEEAINLLKRFLSSWEKGNIPETPEYHIPKIEDVKLITIDRELTQANIILGHHGVKRSNPDYYAISVMNYIFGGGGFASRLMMRIRDDMGLAYDVHSFFSSDKDTGVFEVGVQTKNESARTVIDVILKEMRRVRSEHVSDRELNDAKSYLTGSFPRRIDTMGKIADFLVLTEFYNLGIDYDKKYPQLINSVTKDDILRVAKKYLHPDRYILVVVGDIEKTGISGSTF